MDGRRWKRDGCRDLDREGGLEKCGWKRMDGGEWNGWMDAVGKGGWNQMERMDGGGWKGADGGEWKGVF